MVTQPSERSITRTILARLNCLAPAVAVLKLHGTVYGRAGTPDLLIVAGGRVALIEVKRPGGRLTPLQRRELARWSAAGAVTAVCRSAAEVEAVIAPLLEGA